MPEISVVVVAYRTPDLVRTCLERLAADPGRRSREIIVVDNASGDETAAVARSFPGVVVVESDSNLGFAGGVNRGLAAATGRYAFIMNPDVEVGPGGIDSLAAFLDAHPETGIAAPKLLNTDGTLQFSCRRHYTLRTILLRRTFLGRLFPNAGLLRRHLMMDYDHASPRPVDWVAGAAMMVNRQAMEDVGLMEERYFLYFEDVDWCTRMQARGWVVHYVPEAVMVHHWQRASRGFTPAARHHIRSGLRFYDRWGGMVHLLRQNLPAVRTATLVLADLVAFSAAFLTAFIVRDRLAFALHKPLWAFSFYHGFFAASLLLNAASFSRMGLYRSVKEGDWIDVAFRITKAATVASLVLTASTFILEMRGYSRLIVLGSWPLTILFAFLARRVLHAGFTRARRERWNLRRIALLGGGKLLDDLEATMRETPESGWDPIRLRRRPWEGLPPDEGMDALIRLLTAERVSDVVVTPESFEVSEEDLPARVLPLRRAGFGVRLLSPFLAALPPQARVEGEAEITWLSLERPALRPSSPAKRTLDLILASLGILIGALPFGAALLLRRLSGRALWEPEEVLRGRWGGTHRVRRLAGGGWLRSYPLLGRVIRGELSLVGPRPLHPGDEAPGGEEWLRVRESHRPGLVGLWTLAPPHSLQEERHQELRYLDEWSPELDLKILARAALRRPRPPEGGGAARSVRPVTALVLFLAATAALVPSPLRAQTLGDAVTPYVNAYDMYELETDAAGRFWIASRGGALRFDPAGGTWTVFPRLIGTGPRGNDVVALCIDGGGRVWTGSATEGFTFYDPLTGRWDRQSEEWPDPRIRVIRCVNGGVFIGTENGFSLKPTPNRTDICAEADPGCILPSYVVNDFAFQSDTMWVATEGGLGRFNGVTWDSASALPPGSATLGALSLAVFQGTLWEATPNRIRRLNNGVWEQYQPIAHRLVAAEGNLYALSTFQVYIWNGQSFEDLGIPFPGDSTVRDIEVKGTVIWVALDVGLARYDRADSSLVYFLPPGPALSGVYSGVAVDGGGGLWAGTSQRKIGVVRYDGQEWGFIPGQEIGSGELEGGWILAMHPGGNRRVWIGHCCCSVPSECALQLLDDDAVTTFPGVLNARSFDTDPSGRLWTGAHGRGLYVLERNTVSGNYEVLFNVTPQSTGGALSSTSIRAVAATSRHAYVGHETFGLDIWPHGGSLNNGQDGSNWLHLSQGLNALLDNAVGAMAKVGDEVWVGTSTGIHRFAGSALQERCPTRDREDPFSLPRRVNALVPDRQGGLWIGTEHDLLYLPRGAACDESGGDFRVFNVDNTPMPSDQIVAGALNAKDGAVWFGTPDGLFRVDPAGLPGGTRTENDFVLYPNPLFPSSPDPGLRRVVFGVKTGAEAVAPVSATDLDQPEVFDLTGRHIGSFVVDTRVDGGAWVWDGTNENGDFVAPGIYLVRAGTSAGESVVRRVGVVR